MYDYIFNNPFDSHKWVVATLTNVSLTRGPLPFTQIQEHELKCESYSSHLLL
jgi:hypothetical protein